MLEFVVDSALKIHSQKLLVLHGQLRQGCALIGQKVTVDFGAMRIDTCVKGFLSATPKCGTDLLGLTLELNKDLKDLDIPCGVRIREQPLLKNPVF